MKEYIVKHNVNIFLASLLSSVILFVGLMVHAHIVLTTSSPMQNFKGRVANIVLSSSTSLEAWGSFDRDIMCVQTDFKIYLENVETNDIIVLTNKHLLTQPPQAVKPGIGLPIYIELKIPNNLTVGNWAPTFEGQYICKKGIFTEMKTQSIQAPIMQVKESVVHYGHPMAL